MQQLSGMLDKILYIEHPEMAKEKIREQSLKNKRQAYTVSTTPEDNEIQLMEPTGGTPGFDRYKILHQDKSGKYHAQSVQYTKADAPGFYEYSNLSGKNNIAGNTIEAEV